MNTHGQTWSLDYTIGMILFLLAIIVALKVVLNQFTNSSFALLNNEAFVTTEYLTEEGIPADWTNDTIQTVGLTTNNNLNITKLRQLYLMDPTRARAYLHMRHPYRLFFEDKDHGILYVNATCSYGDDDVRNNGTVGYDSVAYYFSQPGGPKTMLPVISTAYNASVYVRDETPGTVIDSVTLNGSLDLLLENINYYDTLFLENPLFDLYAGNRTASQVASEVSTWVSRGNTLIVTQQVGVTLAGAEFPTLVLGAGNMTIIAQDPDSAFVLDEDFIANQKFSVFSTLPSFLPLANYSNSYYGMATWSYGEGTVFYIADLEGLYDTRTDVIREVNYTLSRRALGYCEGLDLSRIDAKNMVIMHRYIVYNNKITKLNLLVWDT